MADDLATRLARAHVAGGWDAVAALVRCAIAAQQVEEAIATAQRLLRQSQMGAD